MIDRDGEVRKSEMKRVETSWAGNAGLRISLCKRCLTKGELASSSQRRK